MKKKSIWIGSAIILSALLYVGLKPLLFPTQGGSKSVELTLTVDQAEGDDLIVLDKTYRTDAETLGDLLDEVSKEENIAMQLAGAKTDSFGRYIVGIGQYVTTDSAVGPWWLINSTTNKECVEAGYCNGIDLQSVYDNDVFNLNFTSTTTSY